MDDGATGVAELRTATAGYSRCGLWTLCARASEGNRGDAKCVTEILGDENKEVMWGQNM